MAVRELSMCRITLFADNRYGALEGAHQASEKMLIVRQTGAVQGQLESSTEFHVNVGCSVRAQGEGEKRPCLPSFGGGKGQEGVWRR